MVDAVSGRWRKAEGIGPNAIIADGSRIPAERIVVNRTGIGVRSADSRRREAKRDESLAVSYEVVVNHRSACSEEIQADPRPLDSVVSDYRALVVLKVDSGGTVLLQIVVNVPSGHVRQPVEENTELEQGNAPRCV